MRFIKTIREKQFRSRFFWPIGITLILCLGIVFPARRVQSAPLVLFDHFPRTANYFLRWNLSETQAYELAKYDLLILDMEVQVQSPRRLDLIRRLNPDIKILAYVTAQEMLKRAHDLPPQSLRAQLSKQIPKSWYLKDHQGQRISYWPGSWMLNVADSAPEEKGERWNDRLPNFLHESVMGSGRWDGIFFDNAWDDVSFVNQGDIDLNGMGVRGETMLSIDDQWKKGMKKLLARSRELEGENAILIGNGGNGFMEELNGRMFESFPTSEEGGWSGSISNYQIHLKSSRSPKVSIINVNTGNMGFPKDFKTFRFGFSSALLGDGFYSFDDGDQGHDVNWYFDEYRVTLGAPLGKAVNVFHENQKTWRPDLWRRDFRAGIVIVNSTDRVYEIPLGGMFEAISGEQDPNVNTGEMMDRVVLQPHDGRLLLRPFNFLDDVRLQNGLETRVFSLEGKEVRKFFSSNEPRFISHSFVERTNLDGKGERETVVAQKNKIEIFGSSGKRVATFFPYGSAFSGNVNFAAEDLDHDGQMEIVTATEMGAGPQIRMFSRTGRLLHPGFFAYSKRSTGGVSVALGDVLGDGETEIVVGAGAGLSPRVRIFSKNGALHHSGFRVFDAKFRGGVRVSVGPLRRARKSEIAVAPASHGGPQIRIFKGDGTLLNPGFFAFEPTTRSGILIGITDVDGNGSFELIAQKK